MEANKAYEKDHFLNKNNYMTLLLHKILALARCLPKHIQFLYNTENNH